MTKLKIYDVDVAIKPGTDHAKGQTSTGKQLNDIGLTCKEWIMSSTDQYHRWRVWVNDEDGSCLTFLTLKFRKVTVVGKDLPIPSWCRYPSNLNSKLAAN